MDRWLVRLPRAGSRPTPKSGHSRFDLVWCFHSGKDVTPEDVIASINFHRGEESTSAAKPFVDPITDMKADGGNVIITLESPNADFPFVASDYHLPIMLAVGDKNRSEQYRWFAALMSQKHTNPVWRGVDGAQPQLLENRSRSFRWYRIADDHRPGSPPKRIAPLVMWT